MLSLNKKYSRKKQLKKCQSLRLPVLFFCDMYLFNDFVYTGTHFLRRPYTYKKSVFEIICLQLVSCLMLSISKQQ